MSRPPSLGSSSKIPITTESSFKFKNIFEKALKEYNKKTKQNLIAHPLSTQLQRCDSPAAILNILQDQVDQFNQSRSADERLRKWLSPTINVLYAFSETLGEGISLVNVKRSISDLSLIAILQVFSPAKVIFAGAGVLLSVSDLVCLLVRVLVTPRVRRQPKTSKQAKISLSISLSASKISSDDSRFTRRSDQLPR